MTSLHNTWTLVRIGMGNALPFLGACIGLPAPFLSGMARELRRTNAGLLPNTVKAWRNTVLLTFIPTISIAVLLLWTYGLQRQPMAMFIFALGITYGFTSRRIKVVASTALYGLSLTLLFEATRRELVEALSYLIYDIESQRSLESVLISRFTRMLSPLVSMVQRVDFELLAVLVGGLLTSLGVHDHLTVKPQYFLRDFRLTIRTEGLTIPIEETSIVVHPLPKSNPSNLRRVAIENVHVGGQRFSSQPLSAHVQAVMTDGYAQS